MLQRKVALLILLCGMVWLSAAVPTFAQETVVRTNAPNYVLSLIYGQVSAEGRTVEVQFGVINIGAPSQLVTQAELVAFDDDDTPRIVASQDLRPLDGNNDREVITLTTDTAQFSPGSRQVFRVQIASQPGQPAITSDKKDIAIDIPLDVIAPTPTPAEAGAQLFGIDLSTLNIDLKNRDHLMLLAGIGAATLLILLLLSMLLRKLFNKSPDFRMPWQPPYATVPPLDPHSTAGIRQSWQVLAQNNLITTQPITGAYHVTKLLLGTDGRYLSGWQVMAVRLIQYDQYGRVSRSETLASGRMVKQIDQLCRKKSGALTADQLKKRVMPAAKQLAKQLNKKITSRSAMLPIALDVRFKGIHGEVNIMFELFHYQNGFWQPVDQWQPEMMISGKTLLESYTYSLYGQVPDENLRQFRRRLPDDIARALVEMIGAQAPTPVTPQNPVNSAPPTSISAPVEPPKSEASITNPHLPKVE